MNLWILINYSLIFFSFFVQLFKDHIYMFFVTGVTFFSYFKDIYEILFHM